MIMSCCELIGSAATVCVQVAPAAGSALIDQMDGLAVRCAALAQYYNGPIDKDSTLF